MQIHELNNFSGAPGNTNYLAIDDGTDTGRISGTDLLAPVNTRIDNIVSGVTVDSEVIDGRLGADGVTYGSLGTAIRTQVSDLETDIAHLKGFTVNYRSPSIANETFTGMTATRQSDGTVTISGTPSGVINKNLGTFSLPLGQYKFVTNVNPTGNYYLYFKGVNGTSTWYRDGDIVEVTQTSTVYCYLYSEETSYISFTVQPCAIEYPAYSSSYLNSRIDLSNDVVSNIADYNYAVTLDDMELEWGNYDLSSSTEITASVSRLTTMKKIDATTLSKVTVTAASGYRFKLAVYNNANDVAAAFSSADWFTGTKELDIMFPYCRLLLAKTSGNLTPSDISNFTIVFNKTYVSDSEKERSLMLEKYISKAILHYNYGTLYLDNTNIYAYYPYQASSTTFETNDVWISGIYRCVPGDTLEMILSGETTRPIIQLFQADGTVRHYIVGTGINNNVKTSYTFTSSDRYFRVSTRRTRYRFAYVKYHSQFNNNRYIPDYADTEYKAVLSALQAKQTLGNPIVFGFNTDQHSSAKGEPYSDAVIGLRTMKMLSKAISLDFICLGGDAPSYDSTDVVDILNDVNYVTEQVLGSACPVIPIVGNHDAIDNNSNVTSAELYNVTFKRAINDRLFDYYDSVGCNAYIDSKMHSVRYIFVDSIPRTGYALADANTFLSTALSTMPTGYNALIISHRALNTSLPSDPFGDAIDCSAVLGNYASKIIACISGHSHKDGSSTINSILYICTTTSGVDSLASGDARVLGTATGTAYDVFIVDQSNKKIYAVRYGYGSDRNWTYTL